MPIKFQVEHDTLCRHLHLNGTQPGWVNCWTSYRENIPMPTYYDTREEAEADLREFIAESMSYFQRGELESPPDRNQWRVSAVYVQQQEVLDLA